MRRSQRTKLSVSRGVRFKFVFLLSLMLVSLLLVINGEAYATVAFATNSGGPAYLATDGTNYQADTDYSGGVAASVPGAIITGTTDPNLYDTERYGKSFSYSIPLANGNYTVTLKFAEIYWNAAGKRIFNVSIQGTQVIPNLDIFAEAGGKNIAYDVSFPATVTNGTLTINFTTVVDNAKVSAIEVTQYTPVYGMFYTTNGNIAVGHGFTVTKGGSCWFITFTDASQHHGKWPACQVTPGFSDQVMALFLASYCSWTYADTASEGKYLGSYDGYICCLGPDGKISEPPDGPLTISFTCQW